MRRWTWTAEQDQVLTALDLSGLSYQEAALEFKEHEPLVPSISDVIDRMRWLRLAREKRANDPLRRVVEKYQDAAGDVMVSEEDLARLIEARTVIASNRR